MKGLFLLVIEGAVGVMVFAQSFWAQKFVLDTMQYKQSFRMVTVYAAVGDGWGDSFKTFLVIKGVRV